MERGEQSGRGSDWRQDIHALHSRIDETGKFLGGRIDDRYELLLKRIDSRFAWTITSVIAMAGLMVTLVGVVVAVFKT